MAMLARRADGPVPTWFEDWLEAERAAHTLRIWSPTLIPGLLQTADYAGALFLAAGADGDSADEMVTARLERQPSWTDWTRRMLSSSLTRRCGIA
jgi:hypothetical protein